MHTRSILKPTKKAKNKDFNAKQHQTTIKKQTVQHINQKLTKTRFVFFLAKFASEGKHWSFICYMFGHVEH